jgi:hypothetical protein
MILLRIDLLSNGFKNHTILGHFRGVFEQLDSSSFCAFMAVEPTNELLSFMLAEPTFRLPEGRV